MKIKLFLLGIAFALVSNISWAACSFTNITEVRSLTNSFDAWKAVTEAMSECGNVTATLDSDLKISTDASLQTLHYMKLVAFRFNHYTSSKRRNDQTIRRPCF